jgi:hypothetical protein
MNVKTKAQIETMGLLIIVILVTMILFFVLVFSMKSKKNPEVNVETDFRKVQTISNFGPTILETTTDCSSGKKTIRELLTDCGFSREILCDGRSSCEVANETILSILEMTLDVWTYDYNLTVETSQKTITYVSTGCISSKDISQERTPFGTTHGSMAMVIKIC